jgi:hypothetical protein
MGIGSPEEPVRSSDAWIRNGVESLNRLHQVPTATEIPLAQADIVSVLLNELPLPFDPSVLKMDCLLDAALGQALRDRWDEAMWAEGFRQLESEERCALSIETYSTYRRLLRSAGVEAEMLAERAVILFERRRDDEFYMGGPQTEGGDLDNDVTVDYRLAAILKKLRYQGETVHQWRWG